MSRVLDAAIAYQLAGLALVPIRPDGSKAPALPAGHPYLRQRASEAELRRWFASGRNGIATVCGQVSGHLETIDFETIDVYRRWRALVQEKAPGLVAQLSWVLTPGHLGQAGLHARYRCPEVAIPGSRILARQAGEGTVATVLIESRGTGSYSIAPGSPPSCHPNGGCWEHVAGPDLLHLPCISASQRRLLLSRAEALDQHRPPPRVRTPNRAESDPVAAEFNRGPDWSEILGPAGWQLLRSAGAVRYWRRPGKPVGGWSATTGYLRGGDGSELLHVFSTGAAPFEPGRSYSKFSAYALLEHHGNRDQAVQALLAHPFGSSQGEGPAFDAPLEQGRHLNQGAAGEGRLAALLGEALGLLRGACVRSHFLTAREDRRLAELLHRLGSGQRSAGCATASGEPAAP
jgi:putative DNA primase/helicase